MNTYRTRSRQETVDIGRSFGESLKPGDVVALIGNLGTGKTTFVSGVCEALGVRSRVTSPTFTMVGEYDAPGCVVVHIDLYRIRSRFEIADLGLEEYFNDRSICLIEWAEGIVDLLPERRYEVVLEYGDSDEERHITIRQMVADKVLQAS